MLCLQHLTGRNTWSTTKLNGTECKIDRIEAIAANLQYEACSATGGCYWIDETDEIPLVALVRFLTLMDDLPPGVIVSCTNKSLLADFESRFQTRF